VIFLELVLQNFGPYRGRQVLNLRPQINHHSRPIILLGGMNGGGKTTLMDAIRLALYGHRAQCSTRGNLSYSEFLSQSVNRHTALGEQTCIELAFEHILNNVSVEFRIKRTWTKNPKGGKDILGVLVDDWPNTALGQIWDERIEDFLPLGISNLFLFDGEQVKELAEQEAPPPVVFEAIRALLGLELAERLSVDIDILVNRKRKALADAQELVTLDQIEQKLLSQQEEYQAAKQQLAAIQNKLEQAAVQQRQASEKFLSEGGKIAGKRSQLETQLRYSNEAVIAQRQAMSDLLAASVLPLALISPLLTQAQAQAQKESRRQQVKIARDVLQERDQRLLNYIGQLAFLPEKIDKIRTFLAQENQALEQDINSDEESWLAVDIETLNQLDNILNHHLPTQLTQAVQEISNLKNQEEDIIAVERQLAAAAPPEAYEKLADDVKYAQAELAQAKAAYETGRRRCEEIAAATEKTKKELSRYSEQNIDKKNDEHIIAASAKVQATLKLFRDKLTLRKLNQLESVVSECFLYLLHKSDLVHRVEIDINTFSLSLYDLQGQAVPKNRLSAGEKQMLAIAFLWGLARVSGRNLPVAIDTPLGRLDSSHRTNLVDRYFPGASHQVILLSTDTEIGEFEIERLRQQDAIAREYLLKYDPAERQTIIESGYFW
jgi:DNA sulfur modification protein DndD